MISESTWQQLSSGDKSVVDEVIIAHLPLANKLARWYAGKYPSRTDDLKAVAQCALVDAIHRIAGGVLKTEFRKTYIHNTIREQMTRYMMEDHLIVIPKYKYIEMAEEHRLKELPIIYRVRYKDDDESNIEEENELTFDIPAPPVNMDYLFIEEFYEALSDNEKMVIELRSQEYTLKEVAQMMGYASHTPVMYILNKIKDKFLRERGRRWAEEHLVEEESVERKPNK